MRGAIISLAIAAVVGAAGCRNDAATQTASNGNPAGSPSAVATGQAASVSPEDLGSIGAQIKKSPNDADRILSQHGLTEQSFAAAVRKVSENPDQAKRYTTAFKAAS